MKTTTARAGQSAQALMDVEQVADLLNCSARHVNRLSTDGRMPEPVLLGSLRRWQRASIEKWIEDGCPAIREREEGAHAGA